MNAAKAINHNNILRPAPKTSIQRAIPRGGLKPDINTKIGLSIAFGNTTRNPNSNWNNARPTPTKVGTNFLFPKSMFIKGSKESNC